MSHMTDPSEPQMSDHMTERSETSFYPQSDDVTDDEYADSMRTNPSPPPLPIVDLLDPAEGHPVITSPRSVTSDVSDVTEEERLTEYDGDYIQRMRQLQEEEEEERRREDERRRAEEEMRRAEEEEVLEQQAIQQMEHLHMQQQQQQQQQLFMQQQQQ